MVHFFSHRIYRVWVANEAAPKKGETGMKTNPVPNDPAGLVAFAQAMAAVLPERSEEFGVSRDVEAPLRASIGAAMYRLLRLI